MWITFLMCYAFALIVLIAPGTLVLRCFSLNLPCAIACAAPLSVATYVVLGQAFWIIQLSMSGIQLFIIALALTAAIALVGKKLSINTLVNCPTVTKSEYTLLTIGLLVAFAIQQCCPLMDPNRFRSILTIWRIWDQLSP